MTPRPPNAIREIAGRTEISNLAVECDPAAPEPRDHCTAIALGRGVVHHLDLHGRGAGVLGQHARQRLRQRVGGVVGGNHDGPERSDRAPRNRGDLRAMRVRGAQGDTGGVDRPGAIRAVIRANARHETPHSTSPPAWPRNMQRIAGPSLRGSGVSPNHSG